MANLADRYRLPAVYDAHYLALAERSDTVLYTADKRLLNSLQGQNDLRVAGLG